MGEAKWRRDHPEAAREAATRDIRRGARFMRELGVPAQAVSSDDMSDWPDQGDGEGVFVPMSIGMRGDLTDADAEKAADMWRKATARYPKALYNLMIHGYDDDPRELWEFPEVCAYVRKWAELVGLDDIDEADRWFGSCRGRRYPPLDGVMASSLGFLAGCGVFGDEMRDKALRNIKKTSEQ